MLARTVTASGAVVAAAALLTAAASIWLVLANPVGVADAVAGRGSQGLAEAVGKAIVEVLEYLVHWL